MAKGVKNITKAVGRNGIAGNNGNGKSLEKEDVKQQQTSAENEILLSLNNDIASIRDKKDILRIIHPKLKQLFNTEDIFICKLDPVNGTLNAFLRVGPKHRYQHPDYEKTINKNFPIHDGFIDTILHAKKPVIVDLEKLDEKSSETAYMKMLRLSGIVESLSIPLFQGGELLGILTFWSDRKNAFTPHHVDLIQKIADQVSIIITNILSEEAIQQRDKQNEILLSISNEIAGIRGKDDLLQIIRDSIKKHVSFEDSYIMRYNEETKTCRAYIYHVAKSRRENPAFKTQLERDYPLDDDISNPHLPFVFDVEEMLNEGMDLVSFVHSTGIKKLVSIKLIHRNQLIGLLVLLSENKNSFNESDRYLLQRLSYQVSIATANIIANEEIEKREAEKSLLLSLSNDMALVRNKEDLARIINQKLKKLFAIKDFTIVALTETRMTAGAYLYDQDNTPYKKKREYVETLFNKFRFEKGLYDVVLNAQNPVVFNIDEIMTREVVPGHIRFFNSLGIKEIVGAALRIGKDDIGILWIQPEQVNSFDTFNQSVFKGVSSQISIALANIIANEEIKQREYEKSILLSLSNEIAAVRDKNDLFAVINSKIKEMFSMMGFAIALIDEDRRTHSAFVLDIEERISQLPDFRKVISQKYDVADGVFNRVMNSGGPVTFETNKLSKQATPPDYVIFWKNAGIQYIIGVPLRVGDNELGCLYFHHAADSIKSIRMDLLKSVCAQLSVAIGNILSIENIRKTDAENLLLLSFSNDLVSVRDKAGLRSIIKKYMKDQFQIKEYIITIKNDEKKSYAYFLHDLQTKDPTDEEFKIITGPSMPIEGSMTGAVLCSETPVIFNLAEVASKYSFPGASFWRSTDAENIMGMRLRIAEEDIGILWARPDQMNERILDGVSSQIAMAIANTLANEKIEMQLKEISNYKQQLEDEKQYLQEEVSGGYTYSDIIGSGPEMQKVFQLLSQVSSANSTVLILGETGTGKELIARAIHNSSQRKDKLMVKVNCAALPPNLIESELFGHEKGSFTGAIEQKLGKFELANHGTLFLDEIGEMPFDLQVKLLRALQEKEIERVGGKATIKTDVRIIAATNRDLQKEVNEGKFRSDLYYRLNVFPITLPPLRNRKDDIPPLAAHFIEKYSRNAGKNINTISQKAMNELMAYSWPGNIRELEHLIERSILLTNGNIIKEIHLPVTGRTALKKTLAESYVKTIDENERDHIMEVLNKCNGKIYGQGGAAELLGIPVSTLNSKIKKLDIRKEHVFVSGKQKG